MTRNGKIARLPENLRNQLNNRLRNGEPGTVLLEWLNKLPAVKKVIKQQFDSIPVSEQNLSEWKAGGYHDWLRLQESTEIIEKITGQGQELQHVARGGRIAEGLANWLSAKFLALARELLESKADPQERWEILSKILGQLSHLRRDDHSAERISIKRKQWDRELQKEDYLGGIAQVESLFNQSMLDRRIQDCEEETSRGNPGQIDEENQT